MLFNSIYLSWDTRNHPYCPELLGTIGEHSIGNLQRFFGIVVATVTLSWVGHAGSSSSLKRREVNIQPKPGMVSTR